MSYVTFQDKDGSPSGAQPTMNYKVVYIFTDRLVFYTSSDAGGATLEPEDDKSISRIESKVERVINFGDIIFDCGPYHNKLCHAQEYPGIDKLTSFKHVQEKIPINADVYCLTIPFFENGYQSYHEKIAYVCATAPKDVYNIITFKNYISRKIEFYQLKTSSDRFNGFNGVLKRKAKFVSFIKGKNTPVIARIYNKGIYMSTNDVKRKFVKYYSFYQQREVSGGAYVASEGLIKNKITAAWANGMVPTPSPDCCLYLKGQTENLVLCLAGPDGKSMETGSDICKKKLKVYHGDIQNALRGIKFSEAFHELVHNLVKRANCKSQEYKLMKWRAEKTIEYAINVDCKYVMGYINGDDYNTKYDYCKKNYGDELKLELKLMSFDNDRIYEAIDTCVYQSPSFKPFQSATKSFNDAMVKAKLMRSSFLETRDVNEEDDFGSESTVVGYPILKKADSNKDIINFTEVTSKSKASTERKINSEKRKLTMQDYIYSKPGNSYEAADLQRMQIFRNSKMKDLQKEHTWNHASRESIKEKFNQHAASLGKSNTDEFVTFLGFLRDASFRASKVIAVEENRKMLANSS